MDDATTRELRMLRARAYGPEPDIAGDPAALARLAELEARALPPEPDAPASDADVDSTPPEPEPTPPSPVTEEAPAGHAPLPHRSTTRRTRALWAASVAIALVVGGALALAYTSMTAVARGDVGVQIATLRTDPGFELPPFLTTQFDEVVVYDDFEGITVISADQGWVGNGGDCIYVVLTEDIDTESEFFNGVMYPGCGAGPFPATVQILVDETMPESLRARLSEGAAVQFVLDGDRVGVFAETD